MTTLHRLFPIRRRVLRILLRVDFPHVVTRWCLRRLRRFARIPPQLLASQSVSDSDSGARVKCVYFCATEGAEMALPQLTEAALKGYLQHLFCGQRFQSIPRASVSSTDGLSLLRPHRSVDFSELTWRTTSQCWL
jgi:hypothetical protein